MSVLTRLFVLAVAILMTDVAAHASVSCGARLQSASAEMDASNPSAGSERGYREYTAPDGKGSARVDATGKGAVLCSWAIYASLEEIGAECFAGEDPGFTEELSRSIARIEQFIIANSSQPVTQDQLNQQKKRLRPANVRRCEGDGPSWYVAVRDLGADRLRAAMDDLLSVPREPVMNPCL